MSQEIKIEVPEPEQVESPAIAQAVEAGRQLGEMAVEVRQTAEAAVSSAVRAESEVETLRGELQAIRSETKQTAEMIRELLDRELEETEETEGSDVEEVEAIIPADPVIELPEEVESVEPEPEQKARSLWNKILFG